MTPREVEAKEAQAREPKPTENSLVPPRNGEGDHPERSAGWGRGNPRRLELHRGNSAGAWIVSRSDEDRHLQRQRHQRPIEQLLDWLAEAQPDIACLQELKSPDE